MNETNYKTLFDKFLQDVKNTNNQFLDISSDGKYLVVGDSNGFLEFWDIELKSRISRIQAYSESLTALLFTNNEHILITAGHSGQLRTRHPGQIE